MPNHSAGGLDSLEDLILGQFPDDVAARRTVELAPATSGAPLVVAIAATTPLGEAPTAVGAIFDGLIAQMIQYLLIKEVAL